MKRDALETASDLLRRALETLPAGPDGIDPTIAAVRHACVLGLAAAAPGPRSAGRPALASFGIPSERRQKWLLRYEDAEVGDIVWDSAIYGDEEAELLARAQYEQSQQQWNCTLFRIAALDPAEDSSERIRATGLETTMRRIRDILSSRMPVEQGRDGALTTIGVALGEIDPEDAPFLAVAPVLRAAHARHLAKTARERDEHEERLARDRRWRESHSEEERILSDDDRALFEQVRRDETDKSAILERDHALAVRIDAEWKRGGRDLLLPIGTLVRIGEPALLAGDWPVPVGGTTGVVTGYSTLRSRPNVVSMMGDVKLTCGETWCGDEDRAVRFNYLAEELETIRHGTVMDGGGTIDRPGWKATHGHGRRGDILYSESLVVASDGWLWRVQPCSGPPECTQITTDDADGRKRFDHLVPLETA